MKKLAIIGDGKMGRRIHELAAGFGFEVKLQLGIENNKNGAGITQDNFKDVDAAIDFSHPGVVKNHISAVAALGVPLVVGTTGWLDDPDWVESVVKEHDAKIVYGSNFSLGVQLFIKLTQQAAALYGNSADFDVSLHEIHHTEKADAPSGTALTLAQKWIAHSGKAKKHFIWRPQKGRAQAG
jgi:4-hydroxy-tetrahydrodipicolinate reductase